MRQSKPPRRVYATFRWLGPWVVVLAISALIAHTAEAVFMPAVSVELVTLEPAQTLSVETGVLEHVNCATAHIDEMSLSMKDAATKTVRGDGSQPHSAEAKMPNDWRTRIPRQLAALAEAWRDEAAWTGMTRAGAFEFPGEIAGVVTLNELVVHGWDVAKASGQPFECEPQLLEAAYRAQQASVARNPNGLPGVFAKPVPVAEDAPLLDRLIGLSGRDPAWAVGPLSPAGSSGDRGGSRR